MEVFELKELLAKLDRYIGELCAQIKSNPHESNVIQPLSFGQEVDGVFIPPKISGIYYGDEATNKACSIISNYYRKNDQPLLSVNRSPGCIRVSSSCLDLVKTINGIKDELKQSLTSLPRRQKSSLVKTAAPGIVLKELYRNIHLVDNPVKINLSWVVSGSSMGKITAKQILETIQNRIFLHQIDGKSIEFLRLDIEKISSYDPNHEFSLVRQTQPHIKYNVRLINGKWINIPAHLPILFCADKEPSFKPIGEIDSIREFDRDKPSNRDYLIKWLGILK